MAEGLALALMGGARLGSRVISAEQSTEKESPQLSLSGEVPDVGRVVAYQPMRSAELEPRSEIQATFGARPGQRIDAPRLPDGISLPVWRDEC